MNRSSASPCGCPCDACVNYCEQCPPACAEGHTYAWGCQLDQGGGFEPMTKEQAEAISAAVRDPDAPRRRLPPKVSDGRCYTGKHAHERECDCP